MTKLSVVLGQALTFLCLSSIPLHAGSIVKNGDFETGDFTGWTTSNWSIISLGHTGNFSATNTGCTSFFEQCAIYQDLTTLIYRTYTFSFWYMNPAGFPVGSSYLQAFSTGESAAFVDLGNQPQDGIWYQETVMVRTDSPTTRIEFWARNAYPAFIDDVSFTLDPVPEPSTLALTGVGALLVARYRKRRRV